MTTDEGLLTRLEGKAQEGSKTRRHAPFLALTRAGPRERRLAWATVGTSTLIFGIAAPFAQLPLAPVDAFLPAYQSALVICEVLTAILICAQFRTLRTRALLFLACGYFLSAFMAIAHALSFPGLFSPTGLLGAGPQTTAWLYFAWHGAFPLLIVAYSMDAGRDERAKIGSDRVAVGILCAAAAALLIATGLTWLATVWDEHLPAIMDGSRDAPAKIHVATATLVLALGAMYCVLRTRPLTVLDLWLAVVMCVWIFEVALAAVLNAGRFDLGWYAGRIYSLLAASFVLVVLLIENGRLYTELAQLRETENLRARSALKRHEERLRILAEIDSNIAAGGGVEATMRTVLPSLKALLAVPYVTAWTLDRNSNEMRWVAAVDGAGICSGNQIKPRTPLDFEMDLLRRGEIQVIEHTALSSSVDHAARESSRYPYVLVVPMIAGGELIGAVGLGSDAMNLPSEGLQIAQEVAAQIAIAIHQARLLESVAEQRLFLRQVIDLDRNFIFAKDREGRFTLANASIAEAYGTTVDALVGRNERELNPNAEEVARFHRDDLHVLDRLEEKFIPEETITDAGGRTRWLQTTKRPIVDSEGRASMVLGVSVDISERRESQERIVRQLEHLNLLDHITRAIGERQDIKSIFQVVIRKLSDSLAIDFGCICLHEQATGVLRVVCTDVPAKASDSAGILAEQASIPVDNNGLSRCLKGDLVYEPDLVRVPFPFAGHLSRHGLGSLVMAPLQSEGQVFGLIVVARRATNAFFSTECEFLRQLSEHVGLAAHQAQLYESLKEAYEELRQTRQAAMQQERLRALGQMASGIAHDINNALSPVSLYVSAMLDTEHGLSTSSRGYLETIQRSVEDVAHTVGRMREFYRERNEHQELVPVDVNTLIQQVVDLTRARWRDMQLQRGVVVHVVTDLAIDLPRVMGIPSEFREAITNLVFNAVDAMPEGGTITMRSRLDSNLRQPAMVVVEVEDEGLGMDEQTRARCLEPFFTTKGERGTGLGLAMVFGAARRHLAELTIDSTPGQGTTVRLAFPIPAPGAEEHAPDPEDLSAPSPRLSLLVVDDDPVLLKSLSDTLEGDGHMVTSALGGPNGLVAFTSHLDSGGVFDAVITDLGMPEVNGHQIAAAVKGACATIPVIMLTGWGQRLISEGELPANVDLILAKPPRLSGLRSALSRLSRSQVSA